MAKRPNETEAPAAKRRLRIPAALAVAFVGTSATVAMSFAGCNNSTPEPIDANQSHMMQSDDGGADGSNVDASIDGAVAIDAQPDAFVPQDAPKPPIDAPKPIDARPDTPVA